MEFMFLVSTLKVGVECCIHTERNSYIKFALYSEEFAVEHLSKNVFLKGNQTLSQFFLSVDRYKWGFKNAWSVPHFW